MNDSDEAWFAVYTKPRQEQVALLNLERQSFECFLPMTQGPAKRRNARNEGPRAPLFPRYLFLRANRDRQNLAVVRSTRGAVGLVRAGVELITLPSSIVAALKTRMDPASGLIPLAGKELQSGDRVRVFDGPFADLEGIFSERRGQTRSLLLFQVLGRDTSVEIDERSLRRIN